MGERSRGAKDTIDGGVFRSAWTSIARPPAFSEAESGPGTLGIRPEHPTVGTEGELVEKIHLVEPLGKDTLLYFDYGGGDNRIAILDGVSPYRAVRSRACASRPGT